MILHSVSRISSPVIRCLGAVVSRVFSAALLFCIALSVSAEIELLSQAQSAPLELRINNSDSSYPVVSQEGRFVFYSSGADNIVELGSFNNPPVQPTVERLYQYDRTLDQTFAITANANGGSRALALFNNDRELIFASFATNLIEANDASEVDLDSARWYSFDLETRTISALAPELELGGARLFLIGSSREISWRLAPDGKTIAVPHGNTDECCQLEIYDRATRTTRTIAGGTNSSIVIQEFSGDSRWLAIGSSATNLNLNDTDGEFDFYMVDLSNDAVSWVVTDLERRRRIEAVSHDGQKLLLFTVGGDSPLGGGTFSWILFDRSTGEYEKLRVRLSDSSADRFLSMRPDARYFTFAIHESVGNFPGGQLVHFDRLTGTSTDVSPSGQQHLSRLDDLQPMSAGGRWVTFPTNANDLIENDHSEQQQVYLYDTEQGTYELVSKPNTPSVLYSGDQPSTSPSISSDGRLVAFSSRSNALVQGITNVFPNVINTEWGQDWHTSNVFIRDRLTGVTSTPTGFTDTTGQPWGSSATRQSGFDTRLSGDGQFAVVRYNRIAPRYALIDVARQTGTVIAGYPAFPAIDNNSRWLAFYSDSSDLPGNDETQRYNVFLQNLTTGELVNITAQGDQSSFAAVMAPDGSHVIFGSEASNLLESDRDDSLSARYIYHIESQRIEPLFPRDPSKLVDSTGLRLFDGGAKVFYSYQNSCFVHDRTTGEDQPLLPSAWQATCSKPTPSDDVARVAFMSEVSSSSTEQCQVFVLDRASGRIVPSPEGIVSCSPSSNYILGRDRPVLSGDGTTLAFSSFSETLAPDGNNRNDVFGVSVDALLQTDNQAPIAISQTIETSLNEARVVVLTGRDDDGDAVSYVIVSPPESGTLTGEPPRLIYTPAEDFVGNDAFVFTLNDGFEDSAEATIVISVGSETQPSPGCAEDCIPPLAAILPASRSVVVGSIATAFATMINPSSVEATNCAIDLNDEPDVTFEYWTSDIQTNAITSAANAAVDVPPNGAQSFVLGFTPSVAFSTKELALTYRCENTGETQSISGLSTFELSSTVQPEADVIAIALTPSADGISVAGIDEFGFYSVATANVGTADTITAKPVTDSWFEGTSLICETEPATGQCLSPPAEEVTGEYPADGVRSYAVFVRSERAISLNPAVYRQFVEFTDATGAKRGSTSVALTTSP